MLLAGLAGMCALMFVALSAEGQPSKETLLKARVAQLEMQLAQSVVNEATCRAQLVSNQVQAAQPSFTATQAEIEKEAGCALDWSVNPVVCKPATAPIVKP